MEIVDWKQGVDRLYRFAGKWKYALIVLLAGLLLLATGGGGDPPAGRDAAEGAEPAAAETFSLSEFEARLTACLSRIEGVGQVELMLTLDSTGREVYASDIRQTTSASYESTVSTVSNGSYGEEPVRVTTTSPEFRGAVVVCQGADDDRVRLAVTEAVGALCGLGADRITVIKMGQ